MALDKIARDWIQMTQSILRDFCAWFLLVSFCGSLSEAVSQHAGGVGGEMRKALCRLACVCA